VPSGPRPVTERCHRTIGQRPLNAALGRLTVRPTAKNDGFFRYASSIRARSTRLAGSERERQIASNAAASSSSIANSIACRHPAMTLIQVAESTVSLNVTAEKLNPRAYDRFH
jgi:hypothetical protein